MLIVPPGHSLLVDVSSCQSRIDWPLAAAWRGPLGEYLAGAICKVTEGNADHPDPQFAANWKGIADVNLVRGGYHFAHPDQRARDALDEAERCVKQIEKAGGFVPGHDFFALDIEDQKSPVGRAFTDWVLTFCERMDGLLGSVCGIYTGGPFFSEHDGNPDPETLERLRKRWSWIAAYVADARKYAAMLAGWGQNYIFHQRSGDIAPHGEEVLRILGIPAKGKPVNVDRNDYPGTREDLEAWVESLSIAHRDTDPGDVPTIPSTPTSKSSQRLQAVREPGLELGDGKGNPLGREDRAEWERDK